MHRGHRILNIVQHDPIRTQTEDLRADTFGLERQVLLARRNAEHAEPLGSRHGADAFGLRTVPVGAAVETHRAPERLVTISAEPFGHMVGVAVSSRSSMAARASESWGEGAERLVPTSSHPSPPSDSERPLTPTRGCETEG